MRASKNKKVEDVYREFAKEKEKTSHKTALPKLYEGTTGVNSKTNAERQLHKIVKLCQDTLEFNSGKNIEEIDFDLDSLDHNEAEVFSNAKYARSKYWKNRFGPELTVGEQSDSKNWLKNFFQQPIRKRREAEESLTANQSRLKGHNRPHQMSASMSTLHRSPLQSAKPKGQVILEQLDDRNEKMVEIIKLINRQLAEFIEREGRMLMARKTQTKAPNLKIEERARICEKEIRNNEEILTTLMKDLEYISNRTDRVSQEG